MDHAPGQAGQDMLKHKLSGSAMEAMEQLRASHANASRKRGRGDTSSGEAEGIMAVHKRRHNAIEQRRRDKINTRIMDIKQMLPPMYNSSTDKASKAQVLSDVILYIQDVQARLRLLGVRDLVPDMMQPVSQAPSMMVGSVNPGVPSAPMPIQANMYANPISPMMAVNVSKPQTGHHHSGQRRTVAPVHISKAQLAAATTAPGFDTRQQKMADPKSQKPDEVDHHHSDTVNGQPIHYSSEILRLLLSAASKDVDNEPDIDPFGLNGMDGGTHGYDEEPSSLAHINQPLSTYDHQKKLPHDHHDQDAPKQDGTLGSPDEMMVRDS